MSYITNCIEICDELDELIRDQAIWSQATFGPDTERGPVGALRHLAKEAIEAAENPDDLEEYADCFLLILDAMRRKGCRFQTLVREAAKKMQKNKLRNWPTPEPDQPVEHIHNS